MNGERAASYVVTPDGAYLYYKDWGSGRPVVLAHGWPLTADMWEYQMRPLADAGYRVIAYDRRGFGRSDQPWGDYYDYDHLAGDLKSVVDTLDLTDATLVGFSMGGGEVVRYLSRYGSDRVRSAVLVASVTPMLVRTADHPEGADPSVFDEMAADLQDDHPKFLTTLSRKLFGTHLSPEMLQWVNNMGMQASPQAALACLRSFSQTDFREDLSRITIPTLVIHGDADESVPIDITGRKAAEALIGGRLHVYDGAPHGIPLTHRAQLAQDLADFLSE